MEFAMPLFAAAIVCFGLIKRVPVFDCFIQGAREGAGVLFQIAPTIIGLVFAVSLLRSSGAVDAICKFVQPAADFLGFPKEVVPMAMLRPVSGSGSSALLISVYEQCGPDSFAGRVASVIAGSSETTFPRIFSELFSNSRLILIPALTVPSFGWSNSTSIGWPRE